MLEAPPSLPPAAGSGPGTDLGLAARALGRGEDDRRAGGSLDLATTTERPKALWLQHDADGPETYDAFLACGAGTDPQVEVPRHRTPDS
ncbi:hypothetical protein [Pseudofrankia sp. BMG5.36]|uniref:hypothetical protein n=1 Tax=Pseudofrankia sp. BMG5.36 TaxID=1834512 RepID=UPI0008DA06DD|nr:hypothetical protein [Pseudofrankia sp. BMG5.36]OHV44544.1 hypothetical protein BCD48_25090 [Pseudofrankia sp. BMG5.36]